MGEFPLNHIDVGCVVFRNLFVFMDLVFVVVKSAESATIDSLKSCAN